MIKVMNDILERTEKVNGLIKTLFPLSDTDIQVLYYTPYNDVVTFKIFKDCVDLKLPSEVYISMADYYAAMLSVTIRTNKEEFDENLIDKYTYEEIEAIHNKALRSYTRYVDVLEREVSKLHQIIVPTKENVIKLAEGVEHVEYLIDYDHNWDYEMIMNTTDKSYSSSSIYIDSVNSAYNRVFEHSIEKYLKEVIGPQREVNVLA